MYIFYNPNPSGLFTDDCTVRAICKALDRDWNDVYLDLCLEGSMLHRMPSASVVWNSYLTKRGFKRFIVPNTCPICYTIKEFAKEHSEGIFIVATDDHVVTIIDGDYYDTGDSGDEIPVYYWKETK